MEPTWSARLGTIIYFAGFMSACEREVTRVGEVDREVEGRGSITVSRTADGSASVRAVYRQGADDPMRACVVTRAGECEFSDCPAALVSSEGLVSAGAIEIEGASRDVRLEPLSEGYGQATAEPWSFEDGSVLSFLVAGAGAIPAHHTAIEAPSAISVTAPEPGASVRRDADLDVAWTAGPRGSRVRFTLGETVDDGARQRALDVRCSAPAERGLLVVPRELLALFEPSSSHATTAADVVNEATVESGAWRAEFFVTTPALDAESAPFRAPVSLL